LMILFALFSLVSCVTVGSKMAANAAVKRGKFTSPPANSVKWDATKFKLRSQITTSGISAGAFVAVQFGVSFSQYVTGTGVLAGGPFYCAADSEITALTACMSQPSSLSTATLVQAMQTAEQNGDIDPISNLGKFYLYSGLFDYTVFTGVVKALEAQLLGVGVAKANISTEYNVPSGHCVSTDSYGNFCVLTESPWINDCLYDAVGAFLNFFYKGLKPKASLPSSINWVTIDLDNYMPSGWTAYGASLSSTAYMYVPSQCSGNTTTCTLHIVWHGCQQGYGQLGDTFITHAGYIQWAITNNMIVLFPQAAESIENPEGCFDWWGYVSSDYSFKTGVQMAGVRNLAVALGAMY